MATLTRKITGKLGQIHVEIGQTSVTSQATTGNTAAETVDGITYDIGQVWTVSTAGNIPLSPSSPANSAGTFAVTAAVGTGSALPAAYSYWANWLRGKFIYTPALDAAGGTVNTVTLAYCMTPNMLPVGDTSEWSVDVQQDTQDSTAQGQSWMESAAGFRSWSGNAKAFYNTSGSGAPSFWTIGAGNTPEYPLVVKLFPAKTVSTEYYLGAAFCNFQTTVSKSSLIEVSISLKGVGPLIYNAS